MLAKNIFLLLVATHAVHAMEVETQQSISSASPKQSASRVKPLHFLAAQKLAFLKFRSDETQAIWKSIYPPFEILFTNNVNESALSQLKVNKNISLWIPYINPEALYLLACLDETLDQQIIEHIKQKFNPQTDDINKLVEQIGEDKCNASLQNRLDAALVDAAIEGKIEWVKSLIDAGANKEVQKPNTFFGFTPLIAAVWSGHLEIVKYLHGINVDLNKLSRRNESALCRAAYCGRYEIIEFLLDKGANPHIRGPEIPIREAALYGHPKCVRLFLEHKTNPTRVTDRYLNRLLEDARREGVEFPWQPGRTNRKIIANYLAQFQQQRWNEEYRRIKESNSSLGLYKAMLNSIVQEGDHNKALFLIKKDRQLRCQQLPCTLL